MADFERTDLQIISANEQARREITEALKLLADQLRKKRREPSYIPKVSDVEDAFQHGNFPFSANKIRYHFLRDFDTALEAAGLLRQEQLTDNNAEQRSYPANAAEIWVVNFIKSNKRRPSFQEVKNAVEQGELPHSQTVKRPGNEGIKQMISRLWAKYELKEL